jgi:hypothetical protein
MTIEQLMTEADKAMYVEKQSHHASSHVSREETPRTKPACRARRAERTGFLIS